MTYTFNSSFAVSFFWNTMMPAGLQYKQGDTTLGWALISMTILYWLCLFGIFAPVNSGIKMLSCDLPKSVQDQERGCVNHLAGL